MESVLVPSRVLKTPMFPEGELFHQNGEFLQYIDRPRRHSRPTQTPFEKLPLELIIQIIFPLDIASLLRLAATNSNFHDLVHDLPDIRTIHGDIEATSALAAFLKVGTARKFTLAEFMAAFKTTTCRFCWDVQALAPFVSLLVCHRICYSCVKNNREHLPLHVDIAKLAFGLQDKDFQRIPFAKISMERNWLSRRMFKDTLEDPVESFVVAPFDYVVNVAERVSRPSESRTLAQIVRDALPTNTFDHSLCGRRNCHLDKSMKIRPQMAITGLYAVNNQAWRGLDPKARWAVVAPLPYLRPKSYPLTLEIGIKCAGCERDAKYSATSLGSNAYLDVDKVYTGQQFQHHVLNCAMAQEIASGEYLSLAEEERILAKLEKLLLLANKWTTPRRRRIRGKFMGNKVVAEHIDNMRRGRRGRTAEQFKMECEWLETVIHPAVQEFED